ncbi:Protein of unknown function [Gryllus bimaculatus]|nr:Protein of unknown function [Gryllus bimaculatus]
MWCALLLVAAVAAAAAEEPSAGRRRLFALLRPRAGELEGGGRWSRDAGPSEGSPFVVMPDASASQPFAVRSVPLLLGNPQVTPLVTGSDISGSEVPVIYATPALLGRRGYINRQHSTVNSGDVSQEVPEPRRILENGNVDINIRVRPYSIFPHTIPAVSLSDIPVTQPDVRDEDDIIGELGISQTMFGNRFRRAIATNRENTETNAPLRNTEPILDHQNDDFLIGNTLHNTKYVSQDRDAESEMSSEDSIIDSDAWLMWKDEGSVPSKPLHEKKTEVIHKPTTELEPPREVPPKPFV